MFEQAARETMGDDQVGVQNQCLRAGRGAQPCVHSRTEAAIVLTPQQIDTARQGIGWNATRAGIIDDDHLCGTIFLCYVGADQGLQ